VALFTDEVGLGQPGAELSVDVTETLYSKCMEMIARGKRLNLAEARMLQPTCQNEVSIQPFPTRGHLREGHPNLKGNASLLRQHAYRSQSAESHEDGVKELADSAIFTSEVSCQRVLSTRVGLISVRKWTLASRAAPECRTFAGCWHSRRGAPDVLRFSRGGSSSHSAPSAANAC
jgi:hypothetical protein